MGGQDGDGAVVGIQGSFPAGAGVDIIEVCCTISVCLRPFAAEGRSEAVGSVSTRLAYPVCRDLTQLRCSRSTSSDQSTQYRHTALSPCDSRRSD